MAKGAARSTQRRRPVQRHSRDPGVVSGVAKAMAKKIAGVRL